MTNTNAFNRSNFLRLARRLRSEGKITVRRERLGGCRVLVVHLDGTLDHVALYQGALGHVSVGCGFTR